MHIDQSLQIIVVIVQRKTGHCPIEQCSFVNFDGSKNPFEIIHDMVIEASLIFNEQLQSGTLCFGGQRQLIDFIFSRKNANEMLYAKAISKLKSNQIEK